MSLGRAFPSPFRDATVIPFSLPAAAHVTLEVFDAAGRRVETLADGQFDAGSHRVRWDAARAPQGVYHYRLHAAGARLAGRVVRTK